MNIFQLHQNLQKFDIRKAVIETFEETAEVIADYNREQLLQGRDSEGNFLSPKYSEDPFFKSPESAKRYAEWKASIEPKRDKPFDVPNLYITGKFHNTIKVDVDSENLKFHSDDSNAKSIEMKFNRDKVYGLNDETKGQYIDEVYFPRLRDKIETRTGLTFQLK
jgi:hypothetical protein